MSSSVGVKQPVEDTGYSAPSFLPHPLDTGFSL